MLNHFIELRRRLLHSAVVFIALFMLFFFYAQELFHRVISPLLHALPSSDTVIATQLTAPLFIPIKLAADAAMLSAAPFVLLQIWFFVSPGLYRRERNHLGWMVFVSLLLFSAGVLFCFYVVLPFMLQCFVHAVPAGVRFMPDMSYAVDFIMHMLLLFGLSFQVPLLCVLLVSLELIDVAALRTMRPYVIVAAFIMGMMLTPPDVLSQVMLAVPLCLLYELGIVLSLIKGVAH